MKQILNEMVIELEKFQHTDMPLETLIPELYDRVIKLYGQLQKYFYTSWDEYFGILDTAYYDSLSRDEINKTVEKMRVFIEKFVEDN